MERELKYIFSFHLMSLEQKHIYIKRSMRLLKVSVAGMMMSLMILSCTKRGSDMKSGMMSVNLDDALPLKEAALSIDVLMLNDSMSSHFPGNITKLEWMGDSILILDSWKDPGLYLYDSGGALVNSYTKRGNGPNEFVGIVDFNVIPLGVVLLDTYSTSQRIYLDQNFTFLYKDDAEDQANHFFCESGNSGGVWYDRGNVAYGSNKDKLIYVDGDSRKPVLPVPREIENVTFASYNVFARVSNDTILYLPAVEPRIYKCHGGQAEVLCELDFHYLWPDFSDVKKDNPLDLMRSIAEDGKIYSTNMLSDGNDVAVSFFCKDDFYVMKFRYNDLSAHKLFKVDKNILESLGTLVSMKDGCLFFGEPGKLLKIRVD